MHKKSFASVCVLVGGLALESTGVAQTPRTVLAREASLRHVKRRIAARDAVIMPAYRALVGAAERAMGITALSVMQKKQIPPSGNKHDYMSTAPYYWPDPTKPGGLPYINRDGEMNPESRVDHDGLRFQGTTDAVEALAL